MKQFSILYEASEFAATRCTGWRFATSDDKYDRNGLLGIAKIHDEESLADEDSFYVVSSDGSIGFCEDGEEIDWLFLSPSGMVKDLPATIQSAPKTRFCPKCGSAVVPGARFCGKCGGQL